MRSIQTEIGFVPPTWCTITDVEIQKCSGKIGIDNMQLIQLMHPEFQINNILAAKRVLENSEICNKVADEQHGSRKNHQAGLLALNKCLIGNICRLLRTSACYSMNDAIGCFDRIDHTLAITTLIQFGIEYNASHTLFQVMQKSLHHIKTGYGILEPVYGDKTVPLAGCGQVNKLGPTLWALISKVILTMCKRAGHEMKLVTSITRLPIS